MKFAVIIEYGADKDGLTTNHAFIGHTFEHSSTTGQLRAAGCFADDAGALWVLDADTAQAADEIVGGDPLVAAGVITSWRIRPLAYWSAQEAKGAR